MPNKVQEKLEAVFNSSNMLQRRPALKAHNESNIPGVYVIGDLAGAPVIKLAMAQGFEVIQHIATKPDAKTEQPDGYDLMIVVERCTVRRRTHHSQRRHAGNSPPPQSCHPPG